MYHVSNLQFTTYTMRIICAYINRSMYCVRNLQVCAMKKNYFELRRIKPRLKRLKECLEEAPYSGERFESDSAAHRVIIIDLSLSCYHVSYYIIIRCNIF